MTSEEIQEYLILSENGLLDGVAPEDLDAMLNLIDDNSPEDLEEILSGDK